MKLPDIKKLVGSDINAHLTTGRQVVMLCLNDYKNPVPFEKVQLEKQGGAQVVMFTCPPGCNHTQWYVETPFLESDSWRVFGTFELPTESILKLEEKSFGKVLCTVTRELTFKEKVAYWTKLIADQRKAGWTF